MSQPKDHETQQSTPPELQVASERIDEPSDLIRSRTHKGLEAEKLKRIQKLEGRFGKTGSNCNTTAPKQ